MNKIDLNKEMAWVTFVNEGFETIWYPVTDYKGEQLEYDSEKIMNHCRHIYGKLNTYFGIAPTSQMIVNNSSRDNI
jgi:glutathione peroxidase-family protein